MGSGSEQQKSPFLLTLDHNDSLNKADDGNSPFSDHYRENGSRLCNSGTSIVFAMRGSGRRRPTRVIFEKRSRPPAASRGGRRRITTARRRPDLQIERKVRILKKLIRPAGKEEEYCSAGLDDNLFRETADYILALQLRVKVMQVMVDVLSSSSAAGSNY